MLWGPENCNTRRIMELVAFSVRRIAHSISPEEFELVIPTSLDDKPDLVEVLQFASETTDDFLSRYTAAGRPSIRRVRFPRILIGSAIWKWTFYPSVSGGDSINQLLLDQYQTVILSECMFPQ